MRDATVSCPVRGASGRKSNNNILHAGLTLKSMRTNLNDKVGHGDLLLWTPQIAGDPCERTLFITAQINEEFDDDTWQDKSMAFRYAQLAADFDRYVIGDTIPIGMEPYDKGDNAFMARISPVEYGIWAIRSVAPKPAIRVLGAFCERDVFIALVTRRRAELGGPGSREWSQAREAAIALWENLFPGEARLLGDNVNDFFSEKAIAV
ncbi:hypothetical protein [uncultured Marivita sp.]|uniref:hypothetical protein n=1 Tax=uncultured Marivita sp. TaxID=888080 RepID=UPI0025CF50BF|nr:hypothetical protein [uncultured Marivita sp.]MCR9111164.1 hypothetical protein [Paracoccaceae bacterium]